MKYDALSAPTEQSSFSIDEFCRRNDISVSFFHRLQREGRAPAIMGLSAYVRRISIEEERAWQVRMSRLTGAEAAFQAAERDAQKTRAQHAGRLAVQSDHHVSRVGAHGRVANPDLLAKMQDAAAGARAAKRAKNAAWAPGKEKPGGHRPKP